MLVLTSASWLRLELTSSDSHSIVSSPPILSFEMLRRKTNRIG